MTAFHEELLIAFATVVLTLFARWAWDRWLSETSRVTLKMCEMSRKLCQQQLLDKICIQDERLDDGDLTFKSTRHYQWAVLLTLLQICSKIGVDCDHITKVMVNWDILE
jgi:hypothetical protein